MEFVGLTGGEIEFQNFKRMSGDFQLWWHGAKDGDRLVLRLAVPVAGRYAVEGAFTKNRDYGDATIEFGVIRKRLQFRADRIATESIPLGVTVLDAGPHDLVVTSHGNAGSDGVYCHLGLDALRLKRVA